VEIQAETSLSIHQPILSPFTSTTCLVGRILALIAAVIPIVTNGSAATDIRAVAVFAGKLAKAVVVDGRVEVVSRHVRLGRCLNQDASRGTGASMDGAEAKMASKVSRGPARRWHQ
jgi:hypothetical protein